jgi:hypothetical protein
MSVGQGAASLRLNPLAWASVTGVKDVRRAAAPACARLPNEMHILAIVHVTHPIRGVDVQFSDYWKANKAHIPSLPP